jgi:hypothetical protein
MILYNRLEYCPRFCLNAYATSLFNLAVLLCPIDFPRTLLLLERKANLQKDKMGRLCVLKLEACRMAAERDILCEVCGDRKASQ